MILDEAIEFCKEKSRNIKLRTEPKTFEQIAEWLEELKAYIEIGTVEECRNIVLDIQKAYNKAIDDFVEELKDYFVIPHDVRVIDEIAPEEISIGDYVLTGGELPAMVLVDAVSRYIDGVLNKASIEEESFTNNLLEYPQYTRPEKFLGREVPEILKSRKSSKNRWMEKRTINENNKTKKTRFILEIRIQRLEFRNKEGRISNGYHKINRTWTNKK